MNVPYWLQLVIYPLIRDTTCYYCIFIRGTLLGAAVSALIAGGLWAKFCS